MKFVTVKHDDQHGISADTCIKPNTQLNFLIANLRIALAFTVLCMLN